MCPARFAPRRAQVMATTAPKESNPHLTTQKSFYVEISRARHRAELVTDDREALGEQLESATGERVAALESLGAEPEGARSLELGKAQELHGEADKETVWARVPTPDVARERAGPKVEL